MNELEKNIEETEKKYREILDKLIDLDIDLASELINVFWNYGSLRHRKGIELIKEIYNL